jgi:hypothetical protein
VIKKTQTEQPDKDSFEYKVEKLMSAFKIKGYEMGGTYPMRVPAQHRISDRRYLADGNIAESYEVLGQLLLKIPFLIKVVGKYLRTYDQDLMLVNAPGLTQPKIVILDYEDKQIENKEYIYSSADKYTFKYQFPTDTEIDQLNEARKRDYIYIISIIWLINLLRSNPPTFIRVGIFRKDIVPREENIVSSYKDIKRILIEAYGKESARIIISVAFDLLNIQPHEFLAGVQES